MSSNKKLSLKRNVFYFDLNASIVLADFMSIRIELQSFGAEDEKVRSQYMIDLIDRGGARSECSVDLRNVREGEYSSMSNMKYFGVFLLCN